jgi:3D (Asp-Asp-Asp) domain-containing protein
VWSFGESEYRHRDGQRTRHATLVIETDEGPRVLAAAAAEVLPIGTRVMMSVTVLDGYGYWTASAATGSAQP